MKSTSTQIRLVCSHGRPHIEFFRSITYTLLWVILSATLYSGSGTSAIMCGPIDVNTKVLAFVSYGASCRLMALSKLLRQITDVDGVII